MESELGRKHIKGVSRNEQENKPQPKKKQYHRHTASAFNDLG